MSIFNRIAAIENKISSIEGRLASSEPASRTTAHDRHVAAGGVSFDRLVNSLSDQRFEPGTSTSTSTSPGQRLDSASVKPYIQEAAAKYDVDPALIEAVIKQESAYDPRARSYVGAEGLMQLMPETAEELGVKNSLDPRENVMGGTKYLRQLIDMFDGNLTKVIAGYNAGPGAVSHYGGIPPYAETQNYVEKVLHNYEEFKAV